MEIKKKNGGVRAGAGRKAKAIELKVAEKFSQVLDDISVVSKLSELVKKGNIKAIELWLAYIYGKPQQKIDHTTDGESINIKPIDWTKSDVQD